MTKDIAESMGFKFKEHRCIPGGRECTFFLSGWHYASLVYVDLWSKWELMVFKCDEDGNVKDWAGEGFCRRYDSRPSDDIMAMDITTHFYNETV